MITTYKAAPDIDVLTSSFPVPGFGLIPINAFVLHAAEPVLVDTGAVVDSDDFMAALRSVIDPADLRWIWLTHTDFDHIGSLHRLLSENPELRVITTFLGVGHHGPVGAPADGSGPPGQPRPGDQRGRPHASPRSGRRRSTTRSPPGSTTTAPAPSSVPTASARSWPRCPQRAEDLSDDELHQGQVFWATVDSPWLHAVDPAVFAASLDGIRRLHPDHVLSSHLPAASGDTLDRLLRSLETVPAASPFVGPDQAALEQMLAGMTGPAPH